MRFLWKSQLKRERGKLFPKSAFEKSKTTRKDRFESRQEKSSYVLVIFLWVFFLGTIGYVGLFSSYLTLTSWQAEGLTLIKEDTFRETVEQELAQKYFGFIPRNRFFLIQPEKLESVLKERYPLIKEVTVKRLFPDRLEVAVAERDTIVLWCTADTCAHLLEDGSVMPTTDAYQAEGNRAHTLTLIDESNQPLRLGTGVFDTDFVALVVSLKRSLQESFGIETENRLTFASRFASELRMRTAAGWEIYFSTRIPLETSLAALYLLLDKEIPKERSSELQYIDLRTENRVFYRYRDGTGTATVVPVAQEEIKVENKAAKEKKK